jgi:DNA-binding beta-propeller fold protein YncE
MKRLARRQVAALSLAGLVLLLTTAAALALTGDLTQPAGTAGCISETGAGPCADGHALGYASGVAVSPDGKSVYVSSGNAVARISRDTTGAITQPAGTAGCISETGSGGSCADGHGLSGPSGVAVSPDGKSVYAASVSSDAVVRLNRNTATGAIAQPAGAAGCISEDGSGPCADGHGLTNASGVAVSPDGRSVYVTANSADGIGEVTRLDRDTTTGAITQPAGTAGCISETGSGGSCADGHGLSGPRSVTVSADGRTLYVASAGSDAVARLDRDTTTGAITQPAGTAGCISETGSGGSCADGHGLSNPYGTAGVAVSADGKSVYVAATEAVARLNRNTTTGAITQPAGTAGCISETGTGPCADGRALKSPRSVAVSADGKSVYAASVISDAVARLSRNTTTGAITQPAGTAGCISETGAGPCADGHRLSHPYGVAVSPDGKSVYVASYTGFAVARLNRAP